MTDFTLVRPRKGSLFFCDATGRTWPVSAAPAVCLRVRWWGHSCGVSGRAVRQLMTPVSAAPLSHFRVRSQRYSSRASCELARQLMAQLVTSPPSIAALRKFHSNYETDSIQLLGEPLPGLQRGHIRS